MSTSGTQRQHIDTIRTEKFSIGCATPNPLAHSLHQAIIHLSAELYQKDVHFVSELIQNAEDNAYAQGVEPALELVLITEDIAEVGAPATLLLFNNEKGFEKNHISALCAVGNSTKKGQRNEGYIGEKGIGFKRVFLVTHTPYIISNGYRIRFSDMDGPAADIAYIVPEWVDKPSDQVLRRIYGGSTLPTTTIALPLRADKVAAVQSELRQFSAETIMFLKRITRLRIRDETRTPHGEVNIYRSDSPRVRVGGSDSMESSTVSLTVTREPEHLTEECRYYVSEEMFPITASVEQRKEATTWTITLAFPYANRPSGHPSANIYAFLPSHVNSGLNFIINADFLLVSSRASLRYDNPWNSGILACVPVAFLNVMRTLTSNQTGPSPSIAAQHLYKYIPVTPLQQSEFTFIQTAILSSLKNEDVVLVDSAVGHSGVSPRVNFFCRPDFGRQIIPKFRRLLERANALTFIASTLRDSSWYIVDNTVQNHYTSVLDQLGVPFMSWQEYLSIVNDRGWLLQLPDDLYLNVVDFIAIDLPCLPNSNRQFVKGYIENNVPILKYQKEDGSHSLATVSEVKTEKKFRIYATHSSKGQWLQSAQWIYTFTPWIQIHFMPPRTAKAMDELDSRQWQLKTWLKDEANISELSVKEYAVQLMEKLKPGSNCSVQYVILVSRFLQAAIQNRHLSLEYVSEHVGKFEEVAIVDSSGYVRSVTRARRSTILLPPHESKWPILLGNNTWDNKVIKMSNDYLKRTPNNLLSNADDVEVSKHFLKNVFGATDLPDLNPIDAPLPSSSLSTNMTNAQSVLLLQWLDTSIKKFRTSGSDGNFFKSIRTTAWLKTARHGVRSSSDSCFLPNNELLAFFSTEDVPFLDGSFYGQQILTSFQGVLETIGVITKPAKGCQAVAKHLSSMSSTFQGNLKQVIKLYTYLQKFDWPGQTTGTPRIFIREGTPWKASEECLIRDNYDLFSDQERVLETVYPDNLLLFFQRTLKVPREAVVEDYCKVWLTIASSPPGKEKQYGKIWEIISKQWKNCSEYAWKAFKSKALILSPTTDHEGLRLLAPGSTFIPDDLDLQHLFTNCETGAPPFVWYPEGSESFESQLSLVYAEMGARELSESVESNFIFSASYQRNLDASEGLVTRGLFTAILGFLTAQTEHTFSSLERQEMIRALSDCIEVEIDTPFERNYSLPIPSSKEKLSVKTNAMVYWDYKKGKLFHMSKTHKLLLKSPLTMRDFETQFVETIANGILSSHSSLAPNLINFLKLTVGSGFNETIVEHELRRMNIRIHAEEAEVVKKLRLE